MAEPSISGVLTLLSGGVGCENECQASRLSCSETEKEASGATTPVCVLDDDDEPCVEAEWLEVSYKVALSSCRGESFDLG
jgi:hypothetical protein